MTASVSGRRCCAVRRRYFRGQLPREARRSHASTARGFGVVCEMRGACWPSHSLTYLLTYLLTCWPRDHHRLSAEHHPVEEVQRDLAHGAVAELDEAELAARVDLGLDDGRHGVGLVARDGAQRLGEEELEHLAVDLLGLGLGLGESMRLKNRAVHLLALGARVKAQG